MARYFFFILICLSFKAEAQLLEDSLLVEGHYRTFSYYKPEGRNFSLLFALHGSGGNASHMINAAEKLQAQANAEKVLIVYAEGYKTFWNECRKSANTIANKENIDEEQFFSKLINHFQEKFAIDTEKVFAVGLSGGGQMAYKFGMTMPDKFRAVTVVVANVPSIDNLDCVESNKPVSILIINGTADAVNPYNGGEMKAGNLILGNVRSTEESFRYWTKLAGYTDEPRHRKLPDENISDNITIDEFSFTGKGKPEVSLLRVNNGKHEFPVGLDAFLTAWSFFKRQMR
jgi:polyhydroxybutyrate depolymerase